jgi:hypothetical protein
MTNILFSTPAVWSFLLWVVGLLVLAICAQRSDPRPPVRIISRSDIDKLIAAMASPAQVARLPAVGLPGVDPNLRRWRTNELYAACSQEYAAQFARAREAIRLWQ